VTLQLPQYRAIVVKAGTKPEHVAKLRDTLAQAAAAPEFKDYLESQFAAHDSVVIGEEAERYIDHSLAEWKQSTGS
jgi:tripartite-type tricarboxylate transporter receptor subunit TctC